MSRSGYSDDCSGNELYLYRGSVLSAIRGKRGQQLFSDLVVALDAMTERRLVIEDLQSEDGSVCALGAVGVHRGVEGLRDIDPEDSERVAKTFNVAECLAREVVFMNDEAGNGVTVEFACSPCHGWGEKAGPRGRPIYCLSCHGHGRRYKCFPETPEARWTRMRQWASSQIAGKK